MISYNNGIISFETTQQRDKFVMDALMSKIKTSEIIGFSVEESSEIDILMDLVKNLKVPRVRNGYYTIMIDSAKRLYITENGVRVYLSYVEGAVNKLYANELNVCIVQAAGYFTAAQNYEKMQNKDLTGRAVKRKNNYCPIDSYHHVDLITKDIEGTLNCRVFIEDVDELYLNSLFSDNTLEEREYLEDRSNKLTIRNDSEAFETVTGFLNDWKMLCPVIGIDMSEFARLEEFIMSYIDKPRSQFKLDYAKNPNMMDEFKNIDEAIKSVTCFSIADSMLHSLERR